MPEVLQPLTLFNPVRHFIEITRAVMLEGADLSDILPQLVALAGIGVAIFGAATLAVRKNLA
jgi:ABC-2 type transport system permease protein